MTTTRHHFILGKWTEGQGSEFQSENPATGDEIWLGREATAEEVDEAVYAAAETLRDWSSSHLETRINLVKRFQGFLEERKGELAELISKETGKPLWETKGEVAACIGKVDISYRAFQERCPVVEERHPMGWSMTRHRPHGVMAVFGPYNFPAHLPNGHIVPALIAGNTIVFKPSELTPAVAEFMVDVWNEAGLPPGVLNLVQGGKDTGMALAAHPRLDGLLFTGSASTGAALHEQYGKHPEKILALELGGNNPLIVHDYQDPKAAAYVTVQSAFISSGQRCTCARRLILAESNDHSEYLNELIAMAQGLRVGSFDSDPEPFMGPLVSADAAQRSLKAQELLVELGGQPLLEMQALDQGPAFVSPGIIDVTGVSDRPDEEVFGPLLQVIRVPDLNAAIEEANNTRYGLSAGILTSTRDYYTEFFRRARAGIINWNTQLTGASSAAPFGGVGISGNHRPSAFYAADYCSYPVASIEATKVKLPAKAAPGIELMESV